MYLGNVNTLEHTSRSCKIGYGASIPVARHEIRNKRVGDRVYGGLTRSGDELLQDRKTVTIYYVIYRISNCIWDFS